MKIKYRPEIDGLRAIAVGLVILYHSELNIYGNTFFKGGFIGVDIFFVISGYLITSIILNELVTTNSFSFKYFYERRIRRIMPVLIFIALVSMPFAWICLSPIAFVDFSKSILYSLGFTSNLYFHYSGQEYAALSGFYKPFLHTWSLSVEEQYYILFPILFFITFKYLKKHLFAVLSLGLIFSLLLAEYGSRNYSSLNFYILPTRMWELLLGSIIAHFESKNKIPDKYKILNLIFPSIGILLIGYSAIFFDHSTRHPSFYTLMPIIGVALIICFSNKDELINKVLSTRIFVGVGLISYSLYLWHFPIFAFGRITEITSGDLTKKIFLGIIILLLSIFTYFFIEKPFRNKKNNFRKIMFLLIFSSSVIIIFNSTIILKNGVKERMPEILQNVTLEETHKLIKNSKNEECLGLKDGCVFNSSSNKKVYIIGDSHAASLAFDLKNKIVSKNYQFITYLLGDCGFFPGFDLIDLKTKKIDHNCNDFYFNELQKKLNENSESIIIFVARFPLYLNNEEFSNNKGVGGEKWKRVYASNDKFDSLHSSFKDTVNRLSKINKIILIYPIPEVDVNVPRKLLNQHLKEGLSFKKNFNAQNSITTSYQIYKARTKSSFELFDSIKGKNIYRVYSHKLFCDTLIKDRCLSHDNKNIYYFDNHHLSIKGAKMVNDLILDEIRKINF